MRYCSHCGHEVLDEAVVCVNCGCRLASNANSAQAGDRSIMITLIKVFMIIGCVISGITFLIPLCWTIPMTVTLLRKLDNNEPIGTGFKVCTLIFVSLIAGILLLCVDTQQDI